MDNGRGLARSPERWPRLTTPQSVPLAGRAKAFTTGRRRSAGRLIYSFRRAVFSFGLCVRVGCRSISFSVGVDVGTSSLFQDRNGSISLRTPTFRGPPNSAGNVSQAEFVVFFPCWLSGTLSALALILKEGDGFEIGRNWVVYRVLPSFRPKQPRIQPITVIYGFFSVSKVSLMNWITNCSSRSNHFVNS